MNRNGRITEEELSFCAYAICLHGRIGGEPSSSCKADYYSQMAEELHQRERK